MRTGTELGIGQPPGSSHILNERQQFPAKAEFKLLSFLSVGTKQQSRLKYSHSLMSIPFLVRCHRNKKNLHATLPSGSEPVSLSDRILLLVACRPRARVVRACAVGVARRGAQIGRLGAPCKAGGYWCSLPHGCRCRRAPQLRAIGGPVGRAALRLATGRGHLPFANRAGCKRARARFGRAWVVRAGRAGWMGRASDARKEITCPSYQGGAGRAHV